MFSDSMNHDAVWLAFFDLIGKMTPVVSTVLLAYIAYLNFRTRVAVVDNTTAVEKTGAVTTAAIVQGTAVSTAFAGDAKKGVTEVARAAEITAGKVEMVRQVAEITAGKVEMVRQVAEITADKVELVRQAAENMTDAVHTTSVETHDKIDKVAKTINGQRDVISANVKGLREAMTKHGIACPPHIEDVPTKS